MPHFNPVLVPAMVTPFRPDYSIDFGKVEQLAQYLVDHGCDGLLVNGTTGESPALSMEEKLELVRVVKHAMAGKNIPIMAGVGGNNTFAAVEDARQMSQLGVDALLVVVPYYNKPSQAGMMEHFRRIAQAVDNEIVIYNIPSRCGVQMSADTMAALHRECPNIIGVKQSCPDMDAVTEITAKLPAKTWLTWCGDDTLTLPQMACGAHGVVSVAAHLVAPQMKDMVDAFKAGKLEDALAIHHQIFPIAKELFFLPNPTVVKSALARLGFIGSTMRPPMVEPSETEMDRVISLVEQYKADIPQAVQV